MVDQTTQTQTSGVPATDSMAPPANTTPQNEASLTAATSGNVVVKNETTPAANTQPEVTAEAIPGPAPQQHPQPEPEEIPEHLQVNTPRKEGGLGLIPKIAATLLGIAAMIVTFRSRTISSRVAKIEEDGLLTSRPGNNPIQAIENLYQAATARFPEAKFDKAQNKVKASIRRADNKSTYKFFGPSHEVKERRAFAQKEPSAQSNLPKSRGIVHYVLGLVGFAGKKTLQTAELGVEGTRQVLFDLGNNRSNRADIGINKDITKAQERFGKDINRAAAKSGVFINQQGEQEKIKLGVGTHAKNAGISLVVGAVVMGATMGVCKLIEKLQKKKREARKHTEKVEIDQQIAMMQPQTQVSMH